MKPSFPFVNFVYKQHSVMNKIIKLSINLSFKVSDTTWNPLQNRMCWADKIFGVALGIRFCKIQGEKFWEQN